MAAKTLMKPASPAVGLKNDVKSSITPNALFWEKNKIE